MHPLWPCRGSEVAFRISFYRQTLRLEESDFLLLTLTIQVRASQFCPRVSFFTFTPLHQQSQVSVLSLYIQLDFLEWINFK